MSPPSEDMVLVSSLDLHLLLCHGSVLVAAAQNLENGALIFFPPDCSQHFLFFMEGCPGGLGGGSTFNGSKGVTGSTC